MSKELIGVICLVALLLLIYTGMRVGYCMSFIGFVGLLLISGPAGALSVLALIPWRAICSYTFAAVALFMLTGIVIADAGFGQDLFTCANHWLGKVKGGLSMATATASALLGFITYSTISNITMGKIAVPEMKKYGYEDGLAAASVCGGASLASIVPPSTGFILYSMLSEESLGKLYMAALIPAAVLFLLVLISIYLRCRMKPELAPTSGQSYTFLEKVKSLKMVWPILTVIVLSLIGIYTGTITPTEAAAFCAFICIIFALITRRLHIKQIVKMVAGQAEMMGMIATLLTGAYVFQRLMTLSGLPSALSAFIMSVNANRYIVMAIIIVVYILFGMFSDINAAILITVPIVYPIVTKALGFDGLWFGVIIVSLIELGAISPPLGMNVFTLSGITNIPATKIFKASVPYMICILILIAILVAFPQLATIIPYSM